MRSSDYRPIEEFCHQIAVVALKTRLPVEFVCGLPVTLDFQVKRLYAASPAIIFGDLQGFAPETFTPGLLHDEKLVDESVPAPVLQTEAEGDREIADDAIPILDRPQPAQVIIPNEATDRLTGVGLDKRVAVLGLIPAHHLDYGVDILLHRGPESIVCRRC